MQRVTKFFSEVSLRIITSLIGCSGLLVSISRQHYSAILVGLPIPLQMVYDVTLLHFKAQRNILTSITGCQIV